MTNMYRRKIDEDEVVAFWELGLDTYEIASTMNAREWDVYRVLSKWREKKNDSDRAAVPAKREQALED